MTDPSMWSEATNNHTDLAKAIAHAEGFGMPNAIPTLAHNPGDLVLGDKGHGTLGSEGITVFQDNATGWAALEHQLSMIRLGQSHVYVNSMTIQQMADKWTATQPQAWAHNVADYLAAHGRAATVTTLLKDVL